MTATVHRVALLGAGIMGAGMGKNLVEAGLEVGIWNRTREKAEAIEGATLADSPAAAASGADAVITMLADVDAVREVMTADGGRVLEAMENDAVWIQSSTIGTVGTAEMIDRASDVEVSFIDAPVLGTRAPAEKGELVVLAAGDSADIERATSVFDAIGKQTVELGEAGAATRMKLAINAWLLILTVNLAETMAYAEALGADGAKLLEILDGNPVGSPYAQLKGKAILGREFEPASFALSGAAKDLRLILEAAEDEEIELELARAALRRFVEAEEMGLGQVDMAAVFDAVGDRDDSRPAASP